MHLDMAYKMIAQLESTDDSPKLADLLKCHWASFCLGNIAADFQQICDVKRRTTHFYSTPPDPSDLAAFERLLSTYPILANPENLGPERAVFLVGYGAHLIYDLLWFHNIVTAFVKGDWEDQEGRFTAHSTLLAYQDQHSLGLLPERVGDVLMVVDPAGWLPFDPDDHLKAWQKLVADQLLPGAEVQTIKIFAGRLGLNEDELSARLINEEWLNTHIFEHVSADLIAKVLDTSISLAIKQTQAYLI